MKEHGLNVDIRHFILVADTLTNSGKLLLFLFFLNIETIILLIPNYSFNEFIYSRENIRSYKITPSLYSEFIFSFGQF